MEHKARYCVVRFMPEPIRGEFANIGIVLQSEFGILYRLLPPRLRRKAFTDIPLRELHTAEEMLKAAFGEDAPIIRVREGGKTLAIDKLRPEYLEQYQRLFSQTIRLSETRSLTLEFEDPYLLEEHLVSLFQLLVVPAPKPREYVLPKRRLLRPRVKRDLLDWEVYEKLEEDSVIFGTIPWKMDYTYKSNEHEVGIKIVDFGWKEATYVAGETWGAWMDMVQEKREPRCVRALFGNYNRQEDEHRSAMKLLRKMEIIYDYDNPTERNELESIMRGELSISRRLG
ncbi:MAG: hypothetical protein AMJ37_04615 [Dehalococcoidia bacterium DG_18]|nr:MAG: hypothetical protein AMJ37_04615 [Dehalococcoidia bacterium DG_18]